MYQLVVVSHVSGGDVSGQLAGCLEALITLVAMEWFLTNVNSLMEIKLVLVLESFLAELADVRQALLVNQFVKSQRFRSFESFSAFVAFVGPQGAVRLLVSKQIELVRKFSLAHVALMRLSAKVNFFVNFHTC